MIKFYTSHCTRCEVIKNIMNNKGIEYKSIDSEDEYMDIARKNHILSMPFAEVEGKILSGKELQELINSMEVK